MSRCIFLRLLFDRKRKVIEALKMSQRNNSSLGLGARISDFNSNLFCRDLEIKFRIRQKIISWYRKPKQFKCYVQLDYDIRRF